MLTKQRRQAHMRSALSLMVLLAVAGCDTATEPKPATFDAGKALADYKAMETIISSNGWASFEALGNRSPLSLTAAIGTIGALHELQSGNGARAFALSLFRNTPAQSTGVGAFAETVISPIHLGKTLVYNATTDRYEIDESRTGAPANGTRFILYEIGANGRPDPAREIGYADLLDEGADTGAAIALRLIGVQHGATLLDYRVRAEPQRTGGTINVSGFLAGVNNARLDFTVNVVGTNSGAQTLVDVDFTLNMALRNFQVTGTVQGIDSERDGDGTVHLSAQHGDKTLQVNLAGESGNLDGTIRLNDNPFVTITGTHDSPVLRNALGQPLNGQELLMVLAIVDVSDSVFDLVKNLLRPVDNLIVLAWIL